MPNDANIAILAAADSGMSEKSRTHNVLGIPISSITSQSATRQIIELALLNIETTVAIAAFHKSNMGAKRAMAEATTCVPNGVPLVWLLRLCGFKEKSRAFGPDL